MNINRRMTMKLLGGGAIASVASTGLSVPASTGDA
jgi:hypothetical protein